MEYGQLKIKSMFNCNLAPNSTETQLNIQHSMKLQVRSSKFSLHLHLDMDITTIQNGGTLQYILGEM